MGDSKYPLRRVLGSRSDAQHWLRDILHFGSDAPVSNGDYVRREMNQLVLDLKALNARMDRLLSRLGRVP